MSAITYKCPNCDGGLVFDPESGTYACEYCLSKFTQEELFAEEESAKEASADETVEDVQEEPETESGEREEQQQSAVMYHCPSCGAEIITDETTAATFCFYCHNPIVLSGRLEGEYLPDGVIPFKITKDEAIEKFHEWIQKKKFIPTGFYSKRQIEKMSGVYFPYWIYGCDTIGSILGTARDVRVWRVGDIEYTETKTFDIHRVGTVTFKHLPKTALQKAQNAMLKGIFPYEFGAMEKFHMGYLSGFQAEKRDIEKDSLADEVHKEVKDYAELLRVTDAEVLGSYTDDFYKDTAALTCKKYGLGKAYYQAARCSLSQMNGFIEKLLKESGIQTKELPSGIEFHKRYGTDCVYEFYLNISEDTIAIENTCGENMISGERIEGTVSLEPKGYLVVKVDTSV